MKLTKADILRNFGVPEGMDLKPYEALVTDVQLEEKGLAEGAFAELRMTPDGNIMAEIGFWHEMPVEAPQPQADPDPEGKMPEIALLPAKLLPNLPEGVAMGKNIVLPAGMLLELLNNQDYVFQTGKELDEALAAAQAAEPQLEQPVGEVLPPELLPAELMGRDTRPLVIVPAGVIRALLDAGRTGRKLENPVLPLVLANMIAKSAPKKGPESPKAAPSPRTHLGSGSFFVAGFAQVENDRFILAETVIANKPSSHADYYVPRLFSFFRHVAARISTGVNFELPDVFRDAIMGRLPAETGPIAWRRTQDPASVPPAKVRRRIGFLADREEAEETPPLPARRGGGHPRMRLLGDVLEPVPEGEF